MAVELKITDDDLPVLSAVATQTLNLINDPNITNRKLDELIRRDPGLTQRVLHTANSPFYMGAIMARTIADAVLRLGMRQLRSILVVAATGELFSDQDECARQMWRHSITTGIACHVIGETLHLKAAEEAFITGILHDVGKMVIYNQHPEMYKAILDKAQEPGNTLLALEDEAFEFFNHTSIGGLVVRKWKLSESVAEAARFHHIVEREIVKDIKNPALAAVASLANAIVGTMGYGQNRYTPEGIEAMACAQFLKFSLKDYEPLCEKIGAAIEDNSSLIA